MDFFFSKDEFCSTLKGKAVSDEEYENSKKLYTLLKMRGLSDLNDLRSRPTDQDVILLLEIMENRFQIMQEKTMYSPRKCNSASKLSSCMQREQSKIIFALLANNSIMEIFEKTLTGTFSCVNTRLPFDTELLMPNLTESDYKKMSIDQSFKAYKRDDLKVMYRIKLDNENYYHERRIITKILKLDENNQYGFAMTNTLHHHGSSSIFFLKLLIRLDIYLPSISSLMRKEQLNWSTCITRFYLRLLKNRKF